VRSTAWWGIGESKTEKVRVLLARDPHPAILFSLMPSAPHRRDSNPDGVLLWEAYQTPRGRMPLPPHAIVVSRAHERNGSPKQRYYAFVCEHPTGLPRSGGGTVDMGTLRNFGDGGKPIGSSQISAVVERAARTGTGMMHGGPDEPIYAWRDPCRPSNRPRHVEPSFPHTRTAARRRGGVAARGARAAGERPCRRRHRG
jgi:hypothetical protein